MFYTADLALGWLGLAGLTLAALVRLNRAGVQRLTLYLLPGATLWFFVLQSGIHATLAGVALALTIPLKASPAMALSIEIAFTVSMDTLMRMQAWYDQCH